MRKMPSYTLHKVLFIIRQPGNPITHLISPRSGRCFKVQEYATPGIQGSPPTSSNIYKTKSKQRTLMRTQRLYPEYEECRTFFCSALCSELNFVHIHNTAICYLRIWWFSQLHSPASLACSAMQQKRMLLENTYDGSHYRRTSRPSIQLARWTGLDIKHQ